MTRRRRSNANDRRLPIFEAYREPTRLRPNAQHRSSIPEVVMEVLTATHSLAYVSDDVRVVRSKGPQPYSLSRTAVVAGVWIACCVVAAAVAPGNARAQGQA